VDRRGKRLRVAALFADGRDVVAVIPAARLIR
jgi:hypothetical protein